MRVLRCASLVGLWVVAAGCGNAAPKALVSTHQTAALVDTNGSDLNGISLNGFSQNGTGASGATVEGFTFSGMTLGTTSVTDVSLSGTSLVGTVTSDAGLISGPGFKGVEMRARLANGVVYTAKVDVVVPWQAVAGWSQNGPTLNGFSQNGTSQNGFSQNGFSQNGFSQNGFSQNGFSQNGPGLAGGHLQFTDAGPPAFVPTPPDGWAYVVTLQSPEGDRPLCGTDASGNAIPAIPLAGRWNYARDTVGGGSHIDDPNTFTFACEGAALAKCVELGYWPWQGADAAAHHEACTRMIRADYCGDGTPHTVDGMLINLYDNEGIQVDTENWPFEAEWTPDGAACVAHQRIYKNRPVTCATAHTFAPANTCGDLSHFQTGTLIMDEYSPSDQIR